MRFSSTFALSCVLSAVGGPFACAQSTASPDTSEAPTISARSTLVLVPALVRNKAGQLIFTLKADDFTLTDDGVPQKLRLEEDSGAEPLALVVAIEGGGAGEGQLAKMHALATMIDSVVGGVPHRVAVVGFDSSPVVVQDFTEDMGKAANAVEALIADDNGDAGAAVLDTIQFSTEMLRRQPLEYRRAILLISETLDRGSHTSLVDALHAISDTNTAIYSIGFSTTKSETGKQAEKLLGSSHAGPAGGCMAKDHADDPTTSNNRAVQTFDCAALLAPPLRLAVVAFVAAKDALSRNVPEEVAKLTGGEYFKLGSEKNLEKDLATISNHIPNRYVLSFQPQSPHAGFHAIGLQVKDYEKLEVTARNGYWADVDAGSHQSPIEQAAQH
jgi:VWFA-related protein